MLLVALPCGASAQTAQHIRILDSELSALFHTGESHSHTFRALVEDTNAAPVLVFIDCSLSLPARLGARLSFVTSVPAVRYVRVLVDCSLPPRTQITLLAHELQHALEIGSRTDIVGGDAMESLYEEIGFQTSSNGRHVSFETASARAVQQAVDRELGERTSGSVVY
jgi:hypothetical protein